jgi:hypothetical protein
VGVALYGKRFAELEGVLRAIAAGKFKRKMKELAAAARCVTAGMLAQNEELLNQKTELSRRGKMRRQSNADVGTLCNFLQ